MTDVVLDASVVAKWFTRADERGSRRARELRDQYLQGELFVTVPSLLFLELLNAAGRRWSWSEKSLLELAVALEELEFEVLEPDLASVAEWTARGLTAYDATYVALAEAQGTPVITDDDHILHLAEAVAQPLVPRG
ncbi:MAG: type II toxin-antitoxin system VapC family toxin [Actinomycetota bacterium]|nr:type II toxin-antitoxin system VapC family toxin [Actinomycetota bacterium]